MPYCSPNDPALIVDTRRTEKNVRNLNWTVSYTTNSDCLAILSFYILAQEYLSLFFCTFFYLFISIPSAISVCASLHLSPHLHLHRHRHLHLPHHFCLPPYCSKQKVFKKGKQSKQFAACHLMIEKSSNNFALLVGNKNTWKLKTTAKKNIDRHCQRPIPNVCHLPDPLLVSHYKLPLICIMLCL